MIKLEQVENGFKLMLDDVVILNHTRTSPKVYIGRGEEVFHEYRGNFKVDDYTYERTPLRYSLVKDQEVSFYYYEKDSQPLVVLSIDDNNLRFKSSDEEYNRFWIRFEADDDERVYGLGEQMSYFNLRGRDFPILTSEPGVGRDKTSYTTFLADAKDKAGGDYYNTNYPEPSFISSKNYWCHVDTTAYGVMNFKQKTFHELGFFEVPRRIILNKQDSLIETVKSFSNFVGSLPSQPEWVHDGVILGLQGGSDLVDSYVQRALKAGVKVSGVWAQDWQGIYNTSFGQRLYWNWEWNEERYPNLPKIIKDYEKKGIKYLGYINPNVVKGGSQYIEGKAKGYLALTKEGQVYDVDYGEFDCGIVDLTNPAAFEWFKEIIQVNMIDFGLKGWMADFAEYLPMDCVLYNGIDAKIMHNYWPVLWARCNYKAVEERGMLGEILYFMRAGAHGIQNYCVSLWAGDQLVEWSRHDGMPTVISGALSSGMMGNPYHHSDIGGYTSLHGCRRSKELFERWLELGTFSSLMRTHEGNRPKENFQFYEDSDTLDLMRRYTEIRLALKPYFRAVDIEGSVHGSGLPMQRPLVLYNEDDPETYSMQHEFLVGEDLLVAPVMEQGETELVVYLPEGKWIHMWTQEVYKKGYYKIDAPIGYIPAFYKDESKYKEVFKKAASLNPM